MDYRLIVATIFLSVATAPSQAADRCSAEFVEQLRTEYTFVDKASVSEITQQIACSRDQRTIGLSYEGTGFTGDDVQEACDKNNRAFFQRNTRVLALSYLPVPAVEQLGRLCDSGPANLTLNVQGSTGDSVVVEAKWSAPGTGVDSVVIQSFTPGGPITCPTSGALRPGARVAGGGTIMTCNRTGDGTVTVVLNVINPNRPREPVSRFASATRTSDPVNYVLSLNSADDRLSCSVNGSALASISFDEDSKQIVLNPSLRPGSNRLVCVAEDLQLGPGGQPCWSYSFNVQRNGMAIADHSFSCCASSPECDARRREIPVVIKVPPPN